MPRNRDGSSEMKTTMTRHSNERVERAEGRTCQVARLSHSPLEGLPPEAFLPSQRVAGRSWSRPARLNQTRVTTGGRVKSRGARVADSPSFLHAIAEELATLRQESVSLVMKEARRLLGEAFLAVELAGSAPGGPSSHEGARVACQPSDGKSGIGARCRET